MSELVKNFTSQQPPQATKPIAPAANPVVAPPKKLTTEQYLEDLDQAMQTAKSQSLTLAGEDRKKFDLARKELQDIYKANEDRIQTGQMITIFGQALAKLGAGLHGLKTGVDLSGVKFDPVNWEQDYQRELDKLKLGFNTLQQQEELARSDSRTVYDADTTSAIRKAELGIRGIEAEKQRQAQQAIVHEQTAARKAAAAAEAAASKEKAEDAFWLKLNDKLRQATTDEAKETAIAEIKGDLETEGYFTKEQLEQKFSTPRWFEFLGRRQLEPKEVAALIGSLRQETQEKPIRTPAAPATEPSSTKTTYHIKMSNGNEYDAKLTPEQVMVLTGKGHQVTQLGATPQTNPKKEYNVKPKE